ncbi:hypothetical protein FA13DRAFT_1741619 [Coprinellus micaceus]|uniref:DUF6533 domain-containing protein n=1 Tax=Coprinellus micaceus TaxID=71717 RepID=A0A4Y7SIJ6_COPMI|nr:hypothetical protein FA13DRAFT_1741619 [Coprinellus micaceus]
MDPEVVAEIVSQIPLYQISQTLRFTQLPAFTALLYHYILTFNDEVSQIWPQPTWKTGKILFLATKYTTIIYVAHLLILNWPHNYGISVPGCEALGTVVSVSGILARTFAEGTLWLCLYALLQGKSEFFYLLVVAFLACSIPANVLNAIDVMSQRAVPQDTISLLLGYPCNFLVRQRPDLSAIGAYISLARTSLTLVAGLATLIIRYRNQNHNLIRVIRREGGMYYISSLVLLFLACLTSTPKSPITNAVQSETIWSLKLLFTTVFADRLLLRMKKVDDPGTQAVISSLVFDHDSDQSTPLSGGSGDPGEEALRDEREAPNPEEGEIVSVVETREKELGKRVEV